MVGWKGKRSHGQIGSTVNKQRGKRLFREIGGLVDGQERLRFAELQTSGRERDCADRLLAGWTSGRVRNHADRLVARRKD